MRLPILSLAFLLALAAPGFGVAGNVATAPGDLARLQGQWTTRAGPERDIRVALKIEGRQATMTITLPEGQSIQIRGEIRINETTAPRALDWVNFVGPDRQEMPDVAAIYELKGDTFRVCSGGPSNPRPTEFKPGDGILADLVTFVRASAEQPAKSARCQP